MRILDIYEGTCESGERLVLRYSFSDTNFYGRVKNPTTREACPFNLSEQTIARYEGYLRDLSLLNTGEIEANLLNEASRELGELDGAELVTRQYGCGIPIR